MCSSHLCGTIANGRPFRNWLWGHEGTNLALRSIFRRVGAHVLEARRWAIDQEGWRMQSLMRRASRIWKYSRGLLSGIPLTEILHKDIHFVNQYPHLLPKTCLHLQSRLRLERYACVPPMLSLSPEDKSVPQIVASVVSCSKT